LGDLQGDGIGEGEDSAGTFTLEATILGAAT
jgi:hypothetical protein